MPLKGFIFAVLAGLCFSLDMALWTTGIMATNASIPTLVGNMAPLWVGLGSVLIFGEKQKRQFWLGLSLAIGGVSVMVLRDVFIPNGMMRGMILGLFAGMFYAGYLLLAQPGRKYMHALPFLFVTTVSTTFSLAIYMVINQVPFTGYSAFTYTIFVIMGVAFQAVAWFLISYSQGYLPAAVISPTLLSQPVLAAIIAYFMLGEELGLYHILSGLIVVAGIYFVHHSREK